MGDKPSSCKGFYLYKNKIHIIALNENLPLMLKRVVLAHELGHSVLHRNSAIARSLNDYTLHDSTTPLEREANLFAAELLILDDDAIEALESTGSFFRAARELGIPPEIMDFKVQMLRSAGYEFNSPIAATGNFLKRSMEVF